MIVRALILLAAVAGTWYAMKTQTLGRSAIRVARSELTGCGQRRRCYSGRSLTQHHIALAALFFP